jgi:hypothetical protein
MIISKELRRAYWMSQEKQKEQKAHADNIELLIRQFLNQLWIIISRAVGAH